MFKALCLMAESQNIYEVQGLSVQNESEYQSIKLFGWRRETLISQDLRGIFGIGFPDRGGPAQGGFPDGLAGVSGQFGRGFRRYFPDFPDIFRRFFERLALAVPQCR